MDDFRIKASEIKAFWDGGDLPQVLNDIFEKTITIFEDEGGKNFILGKVVIENDLPDDESDEDEDEEE